MADGDVVIDIFRAFIGDGLFFLTGAVMLLFAINFMYISASGIKKLDAYFEGGKDYDDTWSIGANFRFFDYCQKFIAGKLKVEDHDMRWWMYFNAVGYAITAFVLCSCVAIDLYLSFFA